MSYSVIDNDTGKDLIETIHNKEYIIDDLKEEIKQKEAVYDSLAVDYRLAQEEIEDLKQKNDYLNDLEASAVEYKELKKENERLNNIIKKFEEDLKDNIDMCDGFIDTATSDLQELGARHNGKTYYQTILLENKIALKIYQKELDKLQELKGSGKE